MTATLLYRISAFVLVLFAAGHTLGFMKFKAPTPEGVAVQQAMDNVRFSLGAKSYTYGDFYRGFGLFCTAYLLFGAFLAWHLGTMARNTPQAIGALGWVFFCLQVVGIGITGDILCCRRQYFPLCWRSLPAGPRGWFQPEARQTAIYPGWLRRAGEPRFLRF